MDHRRAPDMADYIRDLPKAELHVHVEGTLEPELLLELAKRNNLPLPYPSVEAARAAYEFADLQSFLDVYYLGCDVLRQAEDFFDLTWAYMRQAAAQNVRHVELFFDPQAHTERGVPFAVIIDGIASALRRGQTELGISSALIMCFLRHLSADDAMRTLEASRPFAQHIDAVGLDSSERGNPPSKFRAVFAESRRLGLRAVAHAGEEGPPHYITQALDLLDVSRIDHGVRCVEDPDVLARLIDQRVPLTVCPLSNVRLRVFDDMRDHSLGAMLEAGLAVSVHSDDPAYFGGYVAENLLAVQQAFELDADDLKRLARNSFEGAFLDDSARARLLRELDAYGPSGDSLR
jgi:adenosine deaminase